MFQTGGADSGSGGSGGSGSGMECLQMRAQPGPFHYLISEQAKSFVALQVRRLPTDTVPHKHYAQTSKQR